jgi:hypothetical protein
LLFLLVRFRFGQDFTSRMHEQLFVEGRVVLEALKLGQSVFARGFRPLQEILEGARVNLQVSRLDVLDLGGLVVEERLENVSNVTGR